MTIKSKTSSSIRVKDLGVLIIDQFTILHLIKLIEPIFHVCLIIIHYLTLFVVYMPLPL